MIFMEDNGIGLVICRKTLAVHGGSITAGSWKDYGFIPFILKYTKTSFLAF
jgi:light-regulated signal transduction histidine kinase (bacteriophytochrome)